MYLQEKYIGLDLGSSSHEMLPSTIHIMRHIPANFEVATPNGLMYRVCCPLGYCAILGAHYFNRMRITGFAVYTPTECVQNAWSHKWTFGVALES